MMAENKKTKSQKNEIFSDYSNEQFSIDCNFCSVDNFEKDGNVLCENGEFPAAVIDASFFASAVLSGEGEKSIVAQKFIQSVIERNGQFFVPQIFWFEIGNVLLGAAKKRKDGSSPRITTKQLSDILMLISDLPFSTDFEADSEIRLRTLMLAQSENLTYYDASYLELAHRHDIVLKTWDEMLLAAYERD